MQWPPFFGFLVGILSSIIGQLGDLFESSLKRWAAVKDSGDILPGHGGVLDRFDSFLFTAPFLYLLSYFIG
jgi:phosphatidate cytidylyltransferase